jgi:G3E family GTPase
MLQVRAADVVLLNKCDHACERRTPAALTCLYALLTCRSYLPLAL